MSGFWSFVATAAFLVLLFCHLARRRAAATGSKPSGDWERSPPSESFRLRDIRERAGKEPLASPLLRPEPSTALGGGSAGAGRRDPGSPQRRIDESVSAVLRKQIPPRDEAPRSWLGGLPMMPEGVEWPRGVNPENRDEGEVPLHFIAQVACADLPEGLWGGLGPRTGWLLLFVNGNTCMSDDKGVWRVLHPSELGAERQPPADIGPIHDGMYCGSTEFTLRESVYPRWPVDVVCVPNELRIENGRSLAAPDNFAAILYEGAVVADENGNRAKVAPFTWRCLAEAIDRTVASLTAPPNANFERSRLQLGEALFRPGAIEDIVPALERREAEFQTKAGISFDEPDPGDLEPVERERRDRVRAFAAERAEHIREVAEFLGVHPTPEALLERLEREGEPEWRRLVAERLRQLREIAADEGLDQPMTAEHVAAWQQALASLDIEVWKLTWAYFESAPLPVTVERRKLSVMGLLAPALTAASQEVAGRYYVDPSRRGLIPQDAVAELEAEQRRLYENRPHRMGGYHDGLQTDAQPGPTEQLLLLQFATDYGMHWLWGDCGAVYCYISRENLEAGAWDRAEFHLECH